MIFAHSFHACRACRQLPVMAQTHSGITDDKAAMAATTFKTWSKR